MPDGRIRSHCLFMKCILAFILSSRSSANEVSITILAPIAIESDLEFGLTGAVNESSAIFLSALPSRARSRRKRETNTNACAQTHSGNRINEQKTQTRLENVQHYSFFRLCRTPRLDMYTHGTVCRVM